MPTITLYHGTAHPFDAFDDRFGLRGSEPNSSLGIHLTECPSLAADYARLSAGGDAHAGEPRVLLVSAEVDRIALAHSRADFMGREADDDFGTTRSREEFVEIRHRLMDEGYDALVADELGDDLDGCWIVLDPSRLKVLGSVTPDEAEEMDRADVTPPGLDYASVRLFEDDGPIP